MLLFLVFLRLIFKKWVLDVGIDIIGIDSLLVIVVMYSVFLNVVKFVLWY